MMDTTYKQHIPESFSDNAKVWVYQSNRLLSIDEALHLGKMIEEFTGTWNTHGKANKGLIQLLFGQFIVVMVDETSHLISGCSIDASVRFIKDVEKTFSINLFDRQSLAFIVKDKIQVIPMTQLAYAIENNFVQGDTLFFNNLVSNKKELLEKWIVAAKSSWLATKYSFA